MENPYRILHIVLERLDRASEHSVTLMPDFFIDRIVVLEKELEEVFNLFLKVASGGGGNIIVREEIIRGGNAANTASALAALGVKVNLIVITSSLGKALLEYFMQGLPVNLNHVKTVGQESKTVALEAYYKGKKVNIMLSDPGSLECFDTTLFTEDDIRAIKETEVVGVFNWNMNKCSNKLLRELRKLVDKPLFLDTSDPRVASMDRVKELLRILSHGLIDYLSVNENEALFYARMLGYNGEDVLNAAKHLYNNISTKRLYLHTPKYTAVFPDEIVVETLRVKPVKVTGAGDTWNAGIIAGILLDLRPLEQLVLANSLAACYITRPGGKHCNLNELVEYAKNFIET